MNIRVVLDTKTSRSWPIPNTDAASAKFVTPFHEVASQTLQFCRKLLSTCATVSRFKKSFHTKYPLLCSFMLSSSKFIRSERRRGYPPPPADTAVRRAHGSEGPQSLHNTKTCCGCVWTGYRVSGRTQYSVSVMRYDSTIANNCKGTPIIESRVPPKDYLRYWVRLKCQNYFTDTYHLTKYS